MTPPDMPWSYITTEFFAYFWFAIIGVHVWRSGRWPAMAAFIAGGLYGFSLEYGEVLANAEYCYDRFLVMIPWWHVSTPPNYVCNAGPTVPLWIALAWSCTFYAAQRTAERVAVASWVRPFVAALCAVAMDFIADPMAEWMGFWRWYHPGPYFNIPLFNFYGWLVTVVAYVAGLQLLRRRWPAGQGWFGTYGAPFAAIVPAGLTVKAAMSLYTAVTPPLGAWVLPALVFAVALAIVVPWRWRVRGSESPDYIILALTGSYFVYYVVIIAATGLYAAKPMLILSTVIVGIVAALGYGWPYRFKSPGPARTGA